MPLRTQAVGGSTPPAERELTVRQLQAYAAGLSDHNEMYLDDLREDGIVAPPPFVVSLEWPANLAVGTIPNYGVTGAEGLRGVHALQDSIFHRPMRPGDVLTTTATLVEARRIPPGAYSVLRMDTRVRDTGEPIVTSYNGGILRGVEVEGEDRVIDPVPELPGDPNRAWSEKVEIGVSPGLAHVYTECADIWNPIHTERQVARNAGLPDIILHGTASWALASRELINRCADGDPTRMRRLRGRFRAMVLLGTTLTLLYAPSADGSRVDFELLNADGDPVVADGVALFG